MEHHYIRTLNLPAQNILASLAHLTYHPATPS